MLLLSSCVLRNQQWWRLSSTPICFPSTQRAVSILLSSVLKIDLFFVSSLRLLNSLHIQKCYSCWVLGVCTNNGGVTLPFQLSSQPSQRSLIAVCLTEWPAPVEHLLTSFLQTEILCATQVIWYQSNRNSLGWSFSFFSFQFFFYLYLLSLS